jgi:hypothetical protein
VRILESFTDSNLIRIAQNHRNSILVFGKQVWMIFRDMLFSLMGQLHDVRKMWALEIGRRVRRKGLKWDWILVTGYWMPDTRKTGMMESWNFGIIGNCPNQLLKSNAEPITKAHPLFFRVFVIRGCFRLSTSRLQKKQVKNFHHESTKFRKHEKGPGFLCNPIFVRVFVLSCFRDKGLL